jgi:hypothetical protein
MVLVELPARIFAGWPPDWPVWHELRSISQRCVTMVDAWLTVHFRFEV